MMNEIISELKVSKYLCLQLDNIPTNSYNKFIIDGKLYDPVPIYDMPNCIAIESEESFVGKTVEFALL